MAALQYIPLAGLAMTFYEFIFMERKLTKDRAKIDKMMKRLRRYAPELPMWLLIFPEGTLNTPNNRIVSRAFAKKTDISLDPAYVLLPKATGLFMCADIVSPRVNDLFDITMAYSGIQAVDIPYEEYSIQNCFFANQYPKRVHFHIKKYQISDLPGFQETYKERLGGPEMNTKQSAEQISRDDVRREQFSVWLRQRFLEKDALMESFYTKNRFPDVEFLAPSSDANGVKTWFPKQDVKTGGEMRILKTVTLKVSPDWTDWVVLIAITTSIFFTYPAFKWVIGFFLSSIMRFYRLF